MRRQRPQGTKQLLPGKGLAQAGMALCQRLRQRWFIVALTAQQQHPHRP